MEDFDYSVILDYFPFVDIEEFEAFINTLETKVADRDLKIFNSMLYFGDYYYHFVEGELERLEMILGIDLSKNLSDFMSFIEACINI